MRRKRKKFKDAKLNTSYPNGGDEMFFFHKKTKHPAKQISHTNKTWTNKRYTHSPNNPSNYIEDSSLSTKEDRVYYHKSTFADSIYTRGRPYDMNQYRNRKNKKR